MFHLIFVASLIITVYVFYYCFASYQGLLCDERNGRIKYAYQLCLMRFVAFLIFVGVCAVDNLDDQLTDSTPGTFGYFTNEQKEGMDKAMKQMSREQKEAFIRLIEENARGQNRQLSEEEKKLISKLNIAHPAAALTLSLLTVLVALIL